MRMIKPNSYKIDVAVIGAGIAGLYLSKLLEKRGISHLVFEKNDSVGKYGNRIINKHVYQKLRLKRDNVIRHIKEIAFFSPSELKLHKKSEQTRGFVTNIEMIETHLYDMIYNRDKIKLNTFVSDVNFENGSIKANGRKIDAELIIVASGILHNKFSLNMGLKRPKMVFCFTNEIVGDDIITTILDNKQAHGFYGWVMPLQDNIIEIGFGSDRIAEIKNTNLEQRLFSLPYIKHFKKSKNLLRMGGGFIPCSMVEKTCGKNWILIGDSSGGEPLMGGSIHKAIDEAEMAAKAIEKYMNSEMNSLEEFNNLWQRGLGDDLKKQEIIRNVIDNSSNEEIDNVFQRLKNKTIEGEGLINVLFMNIVKNLIKKNREYRTW
jgi:flavin-dependent dehydrogenase